MYFVNQIFYSIHGEGVRYGIPHVFVRFGRCNMTCSFCDTEFESGRDMSAVQVLEMAQQMGGECKNALFCGGEPLLQLDTCLIELFKQAGWYISVETNGTVEAPAGIDWITCSPKIAEHAVKIQTADELKYVRSLGQGIPQPKCQADYLLLSPLFQGSDLDKKTMLWCVELVKDNPAWRLTVQHHKFWGVE